MEEIDENSLEWARKFKKYLRFEPGNLVYLKSDVKRKCPLVVVRLWLHDDEYDYVCTWSTSQQEIKQDTFLDKILQNGNI